MGFLNSLPEFMNFKLWSLGLWAKMTMAKFSHLNSFSYLLKTQNVSPLLGGDKGYMSVKY